MSLFFGCSANIAVGLSLSSAEMIKMINDNPFPTGLHRKTLLAVKQVIL